jgi:hypothetical protein
LRLQTEEEQNHAGTSTAFGQLPTPQRGRVNVTI